MGGSPSKSNAGKTKAKGREEKSSSKSKNSQKNDNSKKQIEQAGKKDEEVKKNDTQEEPQDDYIKNLKARTRVGPARRRPNMETLAAAAASAQDPAGELNQAGKSASPGRTPRSTGAVPLMAAVSTPLSRKMLTQSPTQNASGSTNRIPSPLADIAQQNKLNSSTPESSTAENQGVKEGQMAVQVRKSFKKEKQEGCDDASPQSVKAQRGCKSSIDDIGDEVTNKLVTKKRSTYNATLDDQEKPPVAPKPATAANHSDSNNGKQSSNKAIATAEPTATSGNVNGGCDLASTAL